MKTFFRPPEGGIQTWVLLTVWCAFMTSAMAEPGTQVISAKPLRTTDLQGSIFERCESCNGCHENIYREHVGSMHSQSFANPVFLAQYTQEVLPQARFSGDAFRDARSCTACHAPAAHKQSGARLVRPDPATARSSSVTCDFCHTIVGFRGNEAGNANYIVEPGPIKFGPFQTKTDQHHQYSELQTKSEFCAICHSVRNRYGLDIKSTYAEWQESPHAREGIQCQDCHMSVDGFLTEGRPVHASGVAAFMSLGSAPQRSTLYTHRFQGARSYSQIEGAIQLAFQDLPEAIRPGDGVPVTLLVDNSRTGHKMPSGSVELRFLWLDVYAEIDGQRVDLVPAELPAGYDVTGASPELGQQILAGGVPDGRRIYRTILADRRGKPTLASHLAKSIIFDNRLNAAEVRAETYELALPTSEASRAMIVATMYYVPYPDSFANRLGLPHAEPVRIATTSKEISLTKP